MNENDKFSKQTFYILFFIGIIAAVFVMKTLSSIILPVVFAVLLGFIFLPVVENMKKALKLPWGLSAILVTILAFIVFLLLSSILVTSLTSILGNYTRYENRFHQIYGKIEGLFDFEFDEGKSFFQNIWGFEKIRNVIQQAALLLSSGVLNSGKSILMVFLMMAFFLVEMNSFHAKIEQAFSSRSKALIIMGQKISKKISRFLSIKFFVSLATGLIVFLATLCLHMDFPVVWGILAFIMNFIPIFGSIISSVCTILFSLIQFYPSLWQTVIVIILMVSINMIIGNIIEPKWEGDDLGISTFVILISLSIWGYIWGFLGMLLAVPMTVVIKIVCENINYLKPIGVILGNGSSDSETVDTEDSDAKKSDTETVSDE